MAEKVIVETPHGKVLTIGGPGLRVESRLEWSGGIDRFNVQFKNAQEYLDQAVVRDSTPYVPMRTGALYKTGQLGTTIGEGVVQWIAPYARYIYYGKVLVGPPGNKHPIGKDLNISKSEHPLAQSFWFEAAKAQNKSRWIRNVKYIAGGG